VTYILNVCETYGRFALHKEALSNLGITFSEQAKRLLDWTTGVVLPALLHSESDKTPFHDPNLSRISIEKSFDFPVSPVPTGPPKRRSKRDKTPVKFQTNKRSPFESPGDASSLPQDSSNFSSILAASFAVSLMQSCVVLFSEWLAVGGAGAEAIASSAAKWAKIFDEEGAQNCNELVPAFSRLAMQLCKTAENYCLLKHLLRTIQLDETSGEDEDHIGPMMLVLSSLLSARGSGSASVVKTVHCVLEVAHERIGEDKNFSAVASRLLSSGSGCPKDTGCIAEALELIVSNKQGCIELTSILVDSFLHPAAVSDNVAMFNAQCLSTICNSLSDSAVAPDVSGIVRRLDVSVLNPESEAVPLLRQLVGGASPE